MPDTKTLLKPTRPESEKGKGLDAMSCSRFSFVDVTTEGSEGTLNLFFDDYPVAWVNNLHVAQQIREFLSENSQDQERGASSESTCSEQGP